jgi:hypothetical protein
VEDETTRKRICGTHLNGVIKVCSSYSVLILAI